MPQICDMGQTALLPFRRKACCGFFRPKNPTTSPGSEPAMLGTTRPPKPLCPEVPRVLRKPKVYHRVHKSPTLFLVLTQMNPVHASTPNAFKGPFNIACPSTLRSFSFSDSLGLVCYTFVCIFCFPFACCILFFCFATLIFKEKCKY
jgi:hypothetical protein